MNKTQLQNIATIDGGGEWIVNYAGDRSRVVAIDLPNSAKEESCYVHPSKAYIDAGLAVLIEKLNKAGRKTTYCCSGLEEDHDPTPLGGYITFQGEVPYCPPGIIPEGKMIRRGSAGTAALILKLNL